MSSLDRLKLISLTANEEMTKEIAKRLGVEILPSKVIHFADNEILFESEESFRGDDVYIVQSTCYPVNEHLMEVLICIDACKRADARTINVVIPYFGYARQDRKAKSRQPITAKLVADLLTTAGADRVVAVDLHANQIGGFFNIPVDNVRAAASFYPYFKALNLENVCCVSPDHGGVVRTSKFAEMFDNCPLAIIDKRRPRPNQAELMGIVGDVAGKDCIIVDDIVDTAGTLCLAANKIKELGARHVYAAITHGVLSGPAIERINASALEKLVITDTIPLPESKKSPKIEVISLAPILSKVIYALHMGESLSSAHKAFAKEVLGNH